MHVLMNECRSEKIESSQSNGLGEVQKQHSFAVMISWKARLLANPSRLHISLSSSSWLNEKSHTAFVVDFHSITSQVRERTKMSDPDCVVFINIEESKELSYNENMGVL